MRADRWRRPSLHVAGMRATSAELRWVVTREAPDGRDLVEALRARGLHAVAISAIERTPLPWPRALVGAHPRSIWFLTSPYAARLMRAQGLPADARIAALAPATARFLNEQGHRCMLTATGGAVALARALVEHPLGDADVERTGEGGQGEIPVVLYPTSDAGLAQQEQADAVSVLEKRFSVVRSAVYCTRTAPRFAAELAALPGRGLCVVVHSPSAARALADAVAVTGLRLHDVVAVGTSTAAALPFPARLLPSGADLVEFIAMRASSSPEQS